jgi:hypothetical protein
LIALIVGFEGADWFPRPRFREMCDHALGKAPRARPIGGRA